MGIALINKSKNNNSTHAATRHIIKLNHFNMKKTQISGNTPSFPDMKTFEINKVRLSDFSFSFSNCHASESAIADSIANCVDPNSIVHCAEINYKGFDAICPVYHLYLNVFEIDSPELDENWLKRFYMQRCIESAYGPDETLGYLQPEKVVERFESLYILTYPKWMELRFGKSINELEAWAIENGIK